MPIALITGGSRGLGREMALRIAEKGTDIILTFNSKEAEAADVVELIQKSGRKAAALQLDVSKSKTFAEFAESVRGVLQKFGRPNFDYLVNNAGIGIQSPLTETSEEDFDLLMNIHFKGVYFLTQRLLPLIADGGRIVNISSGLARFALPGFSAYASMKGAIEVLTRYMAKELGPRKIAVNTIAPGAIETDFGGGSVRDNEQINKFVASQTALGRTGQAQDIGGVVASLLSDDNRWINGQRIEVSGGMFL